MTPPPVIPSPAAPPPSPIIDAHLHVWDPARVHYPWLGPHLAPLDRTYRFDDVAPALEAAGVDAVILVQAADDPADTALMQRTADRHPEVVGIVAWAPLEAPDRVAATLDGLRRDDRIVGIRSLIHDKPAGWIAQSAQDAAIGMLADRGIPFDFVTRSPLALTELARLLERHPTARVVVDHLGTAPLDGSATERADWRRLLADVAAHPLAHAKISGLFGPSTPRVAVDAVREVVDVARDLFGADRLMYGGDWPVATLAADYGTTWGLIRGALDGMPAADREAILGGTAARFYRLDAERLARAARPRDRSIRRD